MNRQRAKLYLLRNYHLLVLPLAVILVGTAGYRMLTGMSLLDAFYMTVTTVTTVGYRELAPLDAAGKLFTVALIFAGLSTVWVMAARLGHDFFTAALTSQRRRMDTQIGNIKGHYILCGYGRMGCAIAEHLRREKAEFVVVDTSAEIVAQLTEQGWSALRGDATSEEVLVRAGIREARGLVSVLQNDADNVFVVLTARGISPGLFILARANNEDAIPKLYRSGASKVINPYESAGARIAQTLLRPVVHDFMEVFATQGGTSVSMEQIKVEAGSHLDGRTLREVDIRRQMNTIVVAVKHGENEPMVFNPTGDEKLHAGDILVSIAEMTALDALIAMARKPDR
jgi:voltage-gated potassium channel